jgi:hypothetical protein
LTACRDVANKLFLDADFMISCESSEYHTWVAALGLPMLILFTFGVPATYFFKMLRLKRIGKLQDSRDVYGFFFSGFRTGAWWFELWNTMRKSIFTVGAVLFAPAGVMMQTWAALVLLLVYVVIFSLTQPYEESYLNHLERAALSINVVTLLFGIGLFTNDVSDQSSLSLAMVITFLILLLNVSFMIYVVYTLVQRSHYCAVYRKKRKNANDLLIVQSLFHLVDKNSDGKVSKTELLTAMMRRRMREPTLDAAFQALGERWPQAAELFRPKSAKAVIKAIDTNNDHVLTEEEMLHYLNRVGVKADRTEKKFKNKSDGHHVYVAALKLQRQIQKRPNTTDVVNRVVKTSAMHATQKKINVEKERRISVNRLQSRLEDRSKKKKRKKYLKTKVANSKHVVAAAVKMKRHVSRNNVTVKPTTSHQRDVVQVLPIVPEEKIESTEEKTGSTVAVKVLAVKVNDIRGHLLKYIQSIKGLQLIMDRADKQGTQRMMKKTFHKITKKILKKLKLPIDEPMLSDVWKSIKINSKIEEFEKVEHGVLVAWFFPVRVEQEVRVTAERVEEEVPS